MGKKKTQVGTLVASKLYEKILDLLKNECPENSAGGTCKKNTNAEAPSTCVDRKGNHVDCELPHSFCFLLSIFVLGHNVRLISCSSLILGNFIISVISAEWATNNIREQLMKAVAGALHAATLPDMTTPGGNCWDIGGEQKACNVGDVVRVRIDPPVQRSNASPS